MSQESVLNQRQRKTYLPDKTTGVGGVLFILVDHFFMMFSDFDT